MAASLVEDVSETRITFGTGLTLSYTEKGNFKLGRSKSAILLPADMFAKIFKGLESKFGSGALTISKLSGEELGQATALELDIPKIQQERLKLIKEIFKSRSTYGWGHYKLVQISEDPFELKFRLYDLPAALRKVGGESFKFFLIGFFGGFLHSVFNIPIRHEEATGPTNTRFYEFHFISTQGIPYY